MLPAKLFAALAVAFAVFAGFARLYPLPSVDLGVHSTYFVLGPMLVTLFGMVTSANFAVLYYAVHRCLHARWNRTLSLVHFFLFLFFAISVSLLFPLSTRATNAGEPGAGIGWIFVPLLLAIFSFVTSVLVFAINLTATVVQLVRVRFASR